MVQHPVLVHQQPPSHLPFAGYYLRFALLGTHCAVAPDYIGAVVVVTQNRHHAVTSFQSAQGFFCGIQLIGRDGDKISCKGYQVGVKTVHLIHHPLQRTSTVAERPRMDVAELYDSVAVESLGQIVKGHLYGFDTHAVPFNQNAIAHQQYRHRKRKQSPGKTPLERQTENPCQQSRHCHIKHSQCHPAHTQNNSYGNNLSVHNLY